jgi:polyribonucleotide nucleotidyltransferase
MDFKVAGTGKGLTALQMDIKCDGLTQDLLTEALEQAKQGRLHILKKMLSALARPRSDISPNAPRILTVQVPVEKIGFIIGPSGKNIRALQADYGVKISIDDTGLVNIGGFDAKTAEACAAYIGDMTREVEPGELYTGRVTSIKDFGCFVEILPGQEGLCHVSELSNEFIHAVTDVVRIGDSLEVKVLDIDDFGKIKLSHKATLSGDGDDDKEPVFKRGKGRSVDDYEDGVEEEEELEEEVDEDSAKDDSDEDVDGAEEVEESSSSTDRSRSRDAGPQDRGGRDRGRSNRGGRDGGDRDRGGRSDRGDRPSRGRSDRPDRDRGGRGDRDRPERSDRDRGGRGDRDRPARSDRDRGGRGDRDRPERSDRDRGGRGDRDRPARSDRDRGDRDRPERSDRDRGGSGDRDRSDRPRRRPRRDRD